MLKLNFLVDWPKHFYSSYFSTSHRILYALLGRTLCTTQAPLLQSSFTHHTLILDIETHLWTQFHEVQNSCRKWSINPGGVLHFEFCSWATNDAAAGVVARDRWRSRKSVQLVNSLDGRCRNRVAGDEARACLLQDSVEHRNGIRSVFFRGMAWGCGEPRRRWGVAGTR